MFDAAPEPVPPGLKIIPRGANGAVAVAFGQPSLYLWDPYFSEQHVDWPRVEAEYAVRLLDRPAAQVERIVRQNRRMLIDPRTTTQEALRLFGLRRLPTLEEARRRHRPLRLPRGPLDARGSPMPLKVVASPRSSQIPLRRAATRGRLGAA